MHRRVSTASRADSGRRWWRMTYVESRRTSLIGGLGAVGVTTRFVMGNWALWFQYADKNT
ncbi:hypothetical protein PhaeoP128_01651 [Phaeobacter gallaeciensis]|nr:hypothetical protein PhaeoP129_01651 [Phaeobacter gallaeciensis]ATF22393.1 hypothetical protein PhaeoP128_01651 [Phaeobacter gallaeciensis]